MTEIILRDLRWRVLLVALFGLLFFAWELSVQRTAVAAAAELGPEGIAAPTAYLAGISMIVLLAGFISTDRSRGYARLYFSHPVRPLALYALRWVIAYAISLGFAAALFFYLQLYLWGEIRGGGAALLLPALVALIYGALMAFFSAALPAGDFAVVFLFYLPTFFPPGLLELVAGLGGVTLKQVILLLLPPQSTALTDLYQGLVRGTGVPWEAVLFVLGYAVVWLALAVLVVKGREPA